jgi:hypothetical protein
MVIGSGAPQVLEAFFWLTVEDRPPVQGMVPRRMPLLSLDNE